MKTNLRTSEKGVALIKSFEGFSPVPYKDEGGLLTIGYGTLIDTASEEWLKTAVIDEKVGEILLRTDLKPTENIVNKAVKVEINQNQFDALICFAYNCGGGALMQSTLLKKVNANPMDEAIKLEFMKWVKVGKRTVEGLRRRREAEAMLYFQEV